MEKKMDIISLLKMANLTTGDKLELAAILVRSAYKENNLLDGADRVIDSLVHIKKRMDDDRLNFGHIVANVEIDYAGNIGIEICGVIHHIKKEYPGIKEDFTAWVNEMYTEKGLCMWDLTLEMIKERFSVIDQSQEYYEKYGQAVSDNTPLPEYVEQEETDSGCETLAEKYSSCGVSPRDFI